MCHEETPDARKVRLQEMREYAQTARREEILQARKARLQQKR